MIDKGGFVTQAELELRKTRNVSQSTCQAWQRLPSEAKVSFAQAMAFLGCRPNGTVGAPPPMTSGIDRVAAARLMLLKLGAETDDPRWSSAVLDRLLKAVADVPGGGVGDLLRALFGVLGDYSPDLSKPLAAFIKDVVVQCFSRYTRTYDAIAWNDVVHELGDKATKAQFYLALHAIPPHFVPPHLADVIVKGLECTAYRNEAANALVS